MKRKHIVLGVSLAVGAVIGGIALLARKRENYEAVAKAAAMNTQAINDQYAQDMRDLGHADGQAPRQAGD